MDGSASDLVRALSTLGTGVWVAATVGFALVKAHRRMISPACPVA